jgi:hypothetical protein
MIEPMELKDKSLDLLHNKLVDTIYRFSVQRKVKVVGSNKYRGLLYGSDVDIQSKLTGRENALYNHFKKIVSDKKLMNSVFFMDFKCGYDDRLLYDEDKDNLNMYLQNPLIPKDLKSKILKTKGKEQEDLIRSLFILRWSIADIKKGKIKLIDGSYKSFVDCLKDDTKIKLDLIIPAGQSFIEMSEVYLYKELPPKKEELIKDLEDDIKYYKSFNTLKATKRLFSILDLENKKETKKDRQKLVSLFNSDVGFLNKIMNDLNLLLEVDDKYNIGIEPIQIATQIYKERLGRISYINENKILLLNKINKKNYKRNINQLINYLLLIINEITKKYLKQLEFNVL